MLKRCLVYVIMFIFVFLNCACHYAPREYNDKTEFVGPTMSPKIKVDKPDNYGMIAVGEKFSVGLHYSGDLIMSGNDIIVRKSIQNWHNIVYIASNSDTIAAIDKDGYLYLAGEHAEKFSKALEWNSLVSIAFGKNHIVGLTSGGYVLSAGDNSYGQGDVVNEFGVVAISAAKYHTVIIRQNGTVGFYGKKFLEYDSVLDIQNACSIVAGNDFIAVLTKLGEVVLTNGKSYLGVSKIYGNGECAVFVKKEGKSVFYPKNVFKKNYSNIVSASFSDTNAAVLLSNGSVKVSTNSSNAIEKNTNLWNLRLKLNDNYISGFAPQTSINDALIMLKACFENNIRVESKTSKYIGSGDAIYFDEKLIAYTVVYGDTTGDGIIDLNDVNALKKHIDKTKYLDGALLIAADTLHYISGFAELSDVHINNIQSCVNGENTIKQYNYDPYKEKIANIYSFNKDVIGWISIPNTNIDYPIMYDQNSYYYHHNIHGSESEIGAIYSLYRWSYKNNPIMGHNGRVSGLMFNKLHWIQDNKKILFDYNERIVGITFGGAYTEWEIFSLYETEAHETVETIIYNTLRLHTFSENEIKKWIDNQVLRSEVDLGINISADDTFITLVTCGDVYHYDDKNQARLYVFLRKVG